ncbi:hypothetical protein [Nitratidesulfovibrio liaohensis]|uniref:Transmembrane protein n=1 Tax=Nitratidesulfovibrio liaohensis TaxID=2604158 RepID=A0ABY9R6T2_9BACT|nr:hypothetical protein [Nitratidesulfovibrio liaohensis]WMW67144.1 hypothetical protein KPS_001801 [Nitratidesulfovibrio liaohensis]
MMFGMQRAGGGGASATGALFFGGGLWQKKREFLVPFIFLRNFEFLLLDIIFIYNMLVCVFPVGNGRLGHVLLHDDRTTCKYENL